MNQNSQQFANQYDWLKISPTKEIPSQFTTIASQLFNNWLIQVNEKQYRLLEIEFYYDDNNSSSHNDGYTYNCDAHRTLGHWYFHYSGIDITFGSKNINGGILIRSIEKVKPTPTTKKEQYIFGPLKTQLELLNSFHTAIDGAENIFKLISSGSSLIKVPESKIVQCSRIGLKEKADDPKYRYHNAPYRYLIHPHLGHKEKFNIDLALKQREASVLEQSTNSLS